jgi:hypothetical protein
MMDGYFVTQDIDIVHFKGKKKQTVRKFKWYKNLTLMQEDIIDNNKPYFVYSGTAKPLSLWGVYRFIDGKFKRTGGDYYNFSEE